MERHCFLSSFATLLIFLGSCNAFTPNYRRYFPKAAGRPCYALSKFRPCKDRHHQCRSSQREQSGRLSSIKLSKQRDLPSAALEKLDQKSTKSDVLGYCTQFGGAIRRVRLEGEEADEDHVEGQQSFLAHMSVPTFAAMPNESMTSGAELIARSNLERGRKHDDDSSAETAVAMERQGLEAIVAGAFVLRHAFSESQCEEMIGTCEESLGFGTYRAGKNNHGAMQILVSQEVANSLYRKLAKHMHPEYFDSPNFKENDHAMSQNKNNRVCGINRRWRVYRYSPGGKESFAPHIDAGFPGSGLSADHSTLLWDGCPDSSKLLVSRLTVLIYLNGDFDGGQTKFYAPLSETSDGPSEVIASVKPEQGSLLVFPQAVGEAYVEFARKYWPTHEGSPVLKSVGKPNRPKYVIRTDILFEPSADGDTSGVGMQEVDPNPLFQHDHLVRKTFLPTSSSYNPYFLSHLATLYNPHMGVECAGPLIHSFIRFTKVRQVVEIGAGYTTLWILQALKDNDDEMTRIRSLQRVGKCRLMDWPWTVPQIVESFEQSRSELLCIDNCLHQKETATGAAAVANALGLDDYLHFIKGDAFMMDFKDESIDLLWCDFGVGSKMKEFVRSAWRSIRPGGFLICHSTLTNQATRNWLEALRKREGEDVTGIPSGEFVEISFLEPHKHYQNSLSILQRRASGFEEPLYSEYA